MKEETKKISNKADNDIQAEIIKQAQAAVKNGIIKNGMDAENFIDNLIQPLYQAMLEAELDNKLEYAKYEHTDTKNTNYRNGYCKTKKVQTKYGIMTIKTPRDRNGEFNPIIIPKGAHRLGKFEDIILSLCAKGMSYRDISKLLKEIYGVDISKTQINTFVNVISDVVEKWRNRPLKPMYVFTYADCLYVPIFDKIKTEKKAFYVIVGVNVEGRKEVLGVWCDKSESASFWTSVFEDLKKRGVEDILFTTSDGVAGFKGSLETAFPKTQSQRCIVHLSRNLYQICPKKEASAVVKDFKTIYSSSTLEEAKLALEKFEKKYSDKPKVVEKVKDDMQYIEPLFELPIEIRKAIYTSNIIESVNSALRKVTRGKGTFGSEDSVYKLFYLRIEELQEKWNKAIPNWSIIRSQLVELFGERLTKYMDI